MLLHIFMFVCAFVHVCHFRIWSKIFCVVCMCARTETSVFYYVVGACLCVYVFVRSCMIYNCLSICVC